MLFKADRLTNAGRQKEMFNNSYSTKKIIGYVEKNVRENNATLYEILISYLTDLDIESNGEKIIMFKGEDYGQFATPITYFKPDTNKFEIEIINGIKVRKEQDKIKEVCFMSDKQDMGYLFTELYPNEAHSILTNCIFYLNYIRMEETKNITHKEFYSFDKLINHLFKFALCFIDGYHFDAIYDEKTLKEEFHLPYPKTPVINYFLVVRRNGTNLYTEESYKNNVGGNINFFSDGIFTAKLSYDTQEKRYTFDIETIFDESYFNFKYSELKKFI